MKSPHEIVDQAGRNLKSRFYEEPFSKADIDKEIQILGNYAPNSFTASDYCYNLINKSSVSFQYHIFEQVSRGKYKYFGLNYSYTGPIYWNPKKGRLKQVGVWKRGALNLWEDPRRSS